MKKLLLISSLLAAGTLAANAATTLNISGFTGAMMTGSEYYLTLDQTVVGDEDWSIAFDFTTPSLAASGNQWGSAILSNSTGAFNASFNKAFQLYLSKDGAIIAKVNGGEDDKVTLSLKKDGSNYAIAINTDYHFDLTYTASTDIFLVSVYLKEVSGNTLLGSQSFSNPSFNDFQYLSNSGVDPKSTSTTYISQASYSNFTVTTIPEPSFFGLIAGTLALGLAGTRRRRGNAK